MNERKHNQFHDSKSVTNGRNKMGRAREFVCYLTTILISAPFSIKNFATSKRPFFDAIINGVQPYFAYEKKGKTFTIHLRYITV
jgi:hypothetical protein